MSEMKQTTKETKVTRNTKIEADGQTYFITHGCHEGARGADVWHWEICNGETMEVVDVRDTLREIKQSMGRMIARGGKVMA